MAKTNFDKGARREKKTASVQKAEEEGGKDPWPTTAARIEPELYAKCKRISLLRQADGHEETFTDIIRDAFAAYAKKHRDLL